MCFIVLAARVAAFAARLRVTSRTGRKTALILFSIAVLLAGGVEAVRGQSALDGFDPHASDGVRVTAVQPDGKILLGGHFTSLSPNGGAEVARHGLARLNADGTLDSNFDPKVSGTVYSMAVQADGKILVGGSFTITGGPTYVSLARLNADGTLDNAFNPNADNGNVQAIAVQADGKVLAGGDFTSMGGQPRNNIARLDATTGAADSFDPNANNTVLSLAVQADGKILAGGRFNGANSIGGQARNRMARLDATTGLADSFNPNADNLVYAIAVQADGKILAGGNFNNMGGQPRVALARLNVDGTLDPNFATNAANGAVFWITLQPDGKILVGGFFSMMGGEQRNSIARLTAGGAADSFNPDANSFVFSIAVQTDGKILAVGYFNSIDGKPRNFIARLEADGRLDQTLNLSMIGLGGAIYVTATAIQPDGKILIGGGFISVLGVPRINMARLNTDGTLDPGFNPNASSVIYAIAVQADGKILVGGNFTTIGGQARNHIARLNPATGLADSFNPNANAPVYSIAVQADGKILAGGSFAGANSIGGQMRNRIARLDPTTGLADSFDPNASCTVCGAAGSVWSITVQPDGKTLAGGFFNLIGGQTRNHIARLDATTGLADAFNPNANNGVQSIALQADGKVLAGGVFSEAQGANSIGGQPRNRIARLDGATGLADSFNPSANALVDSIAVQADGQVLAGGEFTSIGGQTRNHIARLDATTGLADSFDPNANRFVYSIAVQADGKILAGGDFSSIGGQRRNLFARLSNDTVARQELAVTQTTLTWTRGGSSPQFTRVTFELSTNNVNYSSLGDGTPAGNSWTLTGFTLPIGQSIYLRARGYYRSGAFNGSESIIESVQSAFFAGPEPTPTPTPSPSATATATATATPSAPPTPKLTPTPNPTSAQFLNLSTRMRVQTGANVGVGGFIITGTASKHVLLRAIGPSLTQLGVPNVLLDPVLELHGPGGFVTITNNNWRDDPVQEALIKASGIPPANDLEPAIDATLAPGAYTAIVRGNNNTSGVALVEVYDLASSALSKLANISTRAFVSTGNDIVIAGFILGNGAGMDNIVARGLGPSLTGGLPDPLPDPTLELRDGNGTLLIANNDWQDDPLQAAIIAAAGLAPGDDLESAIAATLPPGPYTALLAGRNNGTGIGLVEVYDLGDGSGGASPTPSPTATATSTVAPTPTLTPTSTPTPTSTATPTPTATPSVTPTPAPACALAETFNDTTILPGAGWVEINHSTSVGTTGWFQGNGAVFPAQAGGIASYIAANFNNNESADAKTAQAPIPIGTGFRLHLGRCRRAGRRRRPQEEAAPSVTGS